MGISINMISDFFIKSKKIKLFSLVGIIFVACGMLFCFSFAITHADEITQDVSTTVTASPLLSTSVFSINDFSNVLVQPQFTDGTTNVAFYLDINGTYWWQAEQLGSLGLLPFINYWDVSGNSDGGIGNYVAVEYLNDAQQFSCSGLSLSDCVADPHFINQFSFQIVDSDAMSTSTIVANSTVETASTTPSLADALNSTSTVETTTTPSDASSTISIDADGNLIGSTITTSTNEDTTSSDDISTTTVIVDDGTPISQDLATSSASTTQDDGDGSTTPTAN